MRLTYFLQIGDILLKSDVTAEINTNKDKIKRKHIEPSFQKAFKLHFSIFERLAEPFIRPPFHHFTLRPLYNPPSSAVTLTPSHVSFSLLIQ